MPADEHASPRAGPPAVQEAAWRERRLIQRGRSHSLKGSRRDADLSERLSKLKIRGDGSDNDTRFKSDQVDPDERDTYPGVNDDALVENAVQNVGEASATCRSLNYHSPAPQ